MKKLRGAVVGYGFIMDKGHAAAYRQRPDVEIAAIADIAPDRRAAAAAAWPQARIYGDHQALLEGGIHLVDLMLVLFGERPEAVYARRSSGGHERDDADALFLLTLDVVAFYALIQHRAWFRAQAASTPDAA